VSAGARPRADAARLATAAFLTAAAIGASACAAASREAPPRLAAASGADCATVGPVEGTGVGGSRVTRANRVRGVAPPRSTTRQLPPAVNAASSRASRCSVAR
jgi:hypothetical protein